jgi:hypothetical protein
MLCIEHGGYINNIAAITHDERLGMLAEFKNWLLSRELESGLSIKKCVEFAVVRAFKSLERYQLLFLMLDCRLEMDVACKQLFVSSVERLVARYPELGAYLPVLEDGMLVYSS